MTDFDKLERLVRLRDSGGVTEQEFLAEKAKLLSASGSNTEKGASAETRKRWLIGSGIALVVAMAIAGVVAVNRPTDEGGTSDIDVASPADAIPVAPPADALQSESSVPAALPTAMPPEGSYAWATSIFRIGENPAYIEKVLGPARHKSRRLLSYNLSGCPIDYQLQGNEVSGISMIVSMGCTPYVQGRIITPQTQFSSVFRPSGFLKTSCLINCGNKADPTVQYVAPGSHADNFIGASYETFPSEEVTTAWASEIAKSKGVASDIDLPYDAFYCPSRPSQVVVNAMKSATIQTVVVGKDVERCAEW